MEADLTALVLDLAIRVEQAEKEQTAPMEVVAAEAVAAAEQVRRQSGKVDQEVVVTAAKVQMV